MRHYASVLPGGDEECERAFVGCPEVKATVSLMDLSVRIEGALVVWEGEADLSRESKRKYAGTVRALVEFGVETLADLTAERVRAFLSQRRELGFSVERCNQHLSEVRSFVSWLEQRGQMPVGRACSLRTGSVISARCDRTPG